MTVIIHPRQGTIVRVDLNEGFRPPEIGKRRPAVVLSPEIVGRPQMCSIVPLSTTAPRQRNIGAHHLQIELSPPLPSPYDSPSMWVKGDIVLTVAFHRLRHLFSRFEHGQRVYDVRVLDRDTFAAVQQCVRAALGL